MAQFVGLCLLLGVLASLCWLSGSSADLLSRGCLLSFSSNLGKPWRMPPANVGLLYTIKDQNHKSFNVPWLLFERDMGGTDTGGVLSAWRYNGRQCDYQFRVCGFELGVQDNWLVSPYIELEDARRVNVSVAFTMNNCENTKKTCRVAFRIYTLQTDNPNITEAMVNETTFKVAGAFSGVTLDDKTLNYAVVHLDVTARGLFVAFRDEGSCMTMAEMNVTYSICPRLVDRATVLPATLGQTAAKDITGDCVNNTLLVGDAPVRVCEPEGYWGRWLGGDCRCDKGFGVTNTSLCEKCLPGEFKSLVSNSLCLPCPANSNSSYGANSADICTCLDGWYRATNDGPNTDCTRPASAPRNVSVLGVYARNVSLKWAEPVEDGGRSDVQYVFEFTPTLSNSVSTTSVSVMVNGLTPYTNYSLRVGSENGVNKLLQSPGYSMPVTFTTEEDAPDDPPQDFSVDIVGGSLLLTWRPPDVPNGVITKYIIRYFKNETGFPDNRTKDVQGTERMTDVSRTFEEYLFQIQAHTLVGAGPFTEPVKPAAVPGTESQGSELGVAVVAGATVAGGVCLVILLIVILVVCYRNRRAEKQEAYGVTFSNNGVGSNGTGAMVELTPSGKKFYVDPSNYECLDEAVSDFAKEIPASQVALEKAIGAGEFGEVYVGKFNESGGKKSRKVAVKTLKPAASKKNRDDFLVEASIMGQFSHPNVISLVGVVTRAARVMIVIEFMDNGSLDNFLKDNDNKLVVEQQLHMARDVACGMQYLTEMRFIHRDLATRNVLVNSDLLCKVADFGLSRQALDEENAYDVKTGGKIPVRWTAPEAITYRKFTHMSDVWSFGVLLWEIMAFGEHPYYDWPNSKVLESVRRGYRLPPPMNCPEEVHELMLKCWKEERSDRPSFAELSELIDTLLSKQLTKSEAYGVPIGFPSGGSAGAAATYSSIEEWLADIRMERYTDKFVDAGYNDLGLCWQLNENELMERVGVKVKGHRHKILKSINHINSTLERQKSHKI